MTRDNFINKIAPLICKYAKQYNILCPSAVIGQAVLESDGGTSELAKNAHNYFGLKYRAGRCPSACGIYYKLGSEQNKDGSYTSSPMKWMKFNNMESGVQGYFDFINNSNYTNIKGITDPKTYLENIKNDGYATAINYVKNNLNVIKKYNLTKYDFAFDSNDLQFTKNEFLFNGLDYSLVFSPMYYVDKYNDLKKAFGTNSTALFNHFCIYGMKEGRVASANFDVNIYRNNYADLRNAFGNNLPLYYKHYITNGCRENRKCV